jgi:hypothetical protein
MRFQGIDALWEWARAVDPWAGVLDSLAVETRLRVRDALAALAGPRARDGEITVGREIVYARAVAPEAA